MKCTYCGQPGDQLDHVIPRSYTQNDSYERKYVVSCCKECNVHLGNKMFVTIGTRAGYLETRYKQRYATLLKMPEWLEEDIEELQGFLKVKIQQSQLAKKDIEKRLEHLEYIRLTSPTIADIWNDLNE